MNKMYRLIWNVAKEAWVAVAETVKNRGNLPSFIIGSAALMAAVMAGALPGWALDPSALPTGGQIVSGSGTISKNGAAMTVNQGGQRMIANWNTFNIGANASVAFQQPNASAIALNRIQDQNPSRIQGRLSANGQVWLLNASGIMFGKTAQVDVGGLVASSLNITNENFLAGSNTFEKAGTAGSITNQGTIRTADGGYLAFIAPKVSNEGTVTTIGGTSALVAGDKVSLDFTGDNLVTFTIDQGAIDALAENSGLIKADGGLVMLTAKAADALTTAMVNNSGIIEANSLIASGGRIVLDAGESGVTQSNGVISARGNGTGESGGSITITGEKVGLFDTAVVDASGVAGGGTVSIGGGFHGNDTSGRNASQTVVGTNARIAADALDSGNGGKIFLWSNDYTAFGGNISAKGGSVAGDGGFVEVSSKNRLNFLGLVDASATNGTTGTLLLDPLNIIIHSSGSALLADVDQFTDTPSVDQTINPSAITAVTNNGTAVIFQANNDITVNSSILTNNTSGTGGALTFLAGRNITINSSITSDNGAIAFTINDSGADANRVAGAAAFLNNSLVDAGAGNVTITMGTNAGGSGAITTGQITANNLSIAHNGPTAGATTGQIELGETEIATDLTVTTTSARNVINTPNTTIIVRGTANISTTGGDVTLTNANTDFNILQTNAANVSVTDTNAMQIGTTVATGNYTLTTKGPMASYGSETMTVGGMATFTANDGGFGYADPYINLPNSNDFQGGITLTASSTGPSVTGGWATVKDTNSLNIAGATLGSSLTVTTNGALTDSGTITVPSQTILTAGAANDITLDTAANNFNYLRIVNGNNVTLVDTNGINFGSVSGGSGYNSTISGNLNLTAGGDISQYNYNTYEGYSQISVSGNTTFTANHATNPINLYLGPSDPFYTGSSGLGQTNSFIGTVTLARNNPNTGFTNIQLRHTSDTASVLSGLTSVGSLNNVFLKYNSAPAVTLPGMTVGGSLKVYAPSVLNTVTH